MLAKPLDICRGCPLYGNGRGYVPPSTSPSSPYITLYHHPTTQALTTHTTPSHTIYHTHCPPPTHTTTRPPLPTPSCLSRSLSSLPPDTPVLAMGKEAWELAVGTQYPFTKYLGYYAPVKWHGHPIMATYHDRDMVKVPERYYEHKGHLSKVMNPAWPAAFPTVYGKLTPVATRLSMLGALDEPITIDTEYVLKPNHVPGHHPMTMLGVGFSGGVLSFSQGEVARALPLLTEVVKCCPVVMQNAAADISVLAYNGGPAWSMYCRVDDTMLAHAVMFSDLPHSLEYLRQVSGCLNMPKDYKQAAIDLENYNAGDVWETRHIWSTLAPHVAEGTPLHRPYRQLVDLISIHTEATQRGVRVNRKAVATMLSKQLEVIRVAQQIANEWCGYPINLQSLGVRGAVAKHLVEVDKLTIPYSRAKGKASLDKEGLTVLRMKVLPFDSEAEQREGLTVETVYNRIKEGANGLLEARALFANAYQQAGHYLIPLLHHTGLPDVREDTVRDGDE